MKAHRLEPYITWGKLMAKLVTYKAWTDSSGNQHKTEIQADQADAWDEAMKLTTEYLDLDNRVNPDQICNFVVSNGEVFKRLIELSDQMMKEAFKT